MRCPPPTVRPHSAPCSASPATWPSCGSPSAPSSGHPLGLPAVSEAPPLAETGNVPAGPAPLVFEIGVEEMPPARVRQHRRRRARRAHRGAGRHRLTHGEITVDATPRRVVATVVDVAAARGGHRADRHGPARSAAAYDADGNLTKAAQGFARGQGVDGVCAGTHHRRRRRVRRRSAPRSSADRPSRCSPSCCPASSPGCAPRRTCAGTTPGLSFTRPVRWILALLGDAVVPFPVSNLASGRETWVHRNAEPPIRTVPSAEAYAEVLAGARHRAGHRRPPRAASSTGAQELAASVGAVVDIEGEADVVDEIANLVESPNPILGSFAERYLELPAEILTTVMRKHQRYLPVRTARASCMPHFVAVANGACDETVVRAGNEAVLRARYEDAAFFWRADLQVPLAELPRPPGRADLRRPARLDG